MLLACLDGVTGGGAVWLSFGQIERMSEGEGVSDRLDCLACARACTFSGIGTYTVAQKPDKIEFLADKHYHYRCYAWCSTVPVLRHSVAGGSLMYQLLCLVHQWRGSRCLSSAAFLSSCRFLYFAGVFDFLSFLFVPSSFSCEVLRNHHIVHYYPCSYHQPIA